MRFGARSGKSMVIFSNAARGRRRRHTRSAPTNTTVDEARTAAHHRAWSARPWRWGTARPTATEAPMDTAKGTATAPMDSTAPSTGWDRHRSDRAT